MNKTSGRNIWVDYLRSFITILVVAHHSSLAYTTFAWFDKKAYINSTHAIVDNKRSVWLDIFENFNDVFFMSLKFLIGGLFLVKSHQKKGVFHLFRIVFTYYSCHLFLAGRYLCFWPTTLLTTLP